MEEGTSGGTSKRKRPPRAASTSLPNKSSAIEKPQDALDEAPVDDSLAIDSKEQRLLNARVPRPRSLDDAAKGEMVEASVQKLLESDARYVSSRWQAGAKPKKRQPKGKAKKAAPKKLGAPELLKNSLEKWQSAQDRFPFVHTPSFRNCGLNAAVCGGIEADLGHQEPTRVQQLLIPAVLSGQDVVCGSERRSGKTTGYVLPIIQMLGTRQPRLSREDGTRVIVVCRDRTECETAEKMFHAIMQRRCYWLTCSTFTGGENRTHEKARLRKGVTIMITTETRLLDHLENTASFKTEGVEIFVVDNASALLASRRGGAVRRANQLLQEGLREAEKKRMQNVVCTYGQHPDLAYLCNCMARRPFTIGFTFRRTFEDKWSAGALADWKIEPPTEEPEEEDEAAV